jgi:sensor histidine kinase YesM
MFHSAMKPLYMQKSPLNYKTALLLSLSISLLINMLFLIMFFYGKSILPEENRPVQHLRIDITILHIFINFLTAFLLYILNFNLLKHSWFSRRGKRIYIVLLILVCATVISYGCSLIQLQFEKFNPFPKHAIVGGMVRDYFIAVVVTLSSQLIYLSNKQQQTALENERLQAEYMNTRFLALKNQVDPHFLFNSLNTLHSLIKTDAGKAQEYVQQLSQVFRHTLQNKEIITLEEELNFTKAYCHLMQIRYGESLQFIQRIDRKYYPYSIVPLSLQILVENAVKHNVASNRRPLVITLSTSEKESITVSNPIQEKKDPERGENIGLSNLAERYRLLWNKEIAVRNICGLFEVEIPLIV